MLLQMKSTTFLLFIFIYEIEARNRGDGASCVSRDYGKGSIVCVCNSSHCDTIEPIERKANLVTVIESSRAGLRFHRTRLQVQHGSPPLSSPAHLTLTLNTSHTFQSILGFGLAFTDASGISAASLGDQMTQLIIDNYFSQTGLQYSMARLPIAGTDFSARKYTYDDDNDQDFELEGFALQPEDFKYKIQLVKAAQKVAVHDIKLFGSAWSAPAWMKTNDDIAGFGTLIGKPGGPYYKTWAQYYVKFLQAYQNHSIGIWGLTTGNEPINGFIPDFRFNCMAFTPLTQKNFLKLDLGPALNASGFGTVKVMIMDDQRYLLPAWAKLVMQDAEAAQYVSGIAFHWYGNNIAPAQVLDWTHHMYPDKFLISSEATILKRPVLGNWGAAESYAKDIVDDLEHWTTAWIDWNYALDLNGGPNWSKNWCSAPIVVNATANEFYKQPTFYAMGHFSKFLPPDSIRIKVEESRNSNCRGIYKTAFVTPAGDRVLILVNTRNQRQNVTVWDPNRNQHVVFDVSQNAIVTVVM